MYSLDQRVPVCKECCKSSALNKDGTINYPKFKELLVNIAKPLYYDLIESSKQSLKKENSYMTDEKLEKHGYDILSKYFTMVSMRQNRAKSFLDSEREGFIHTATNRRTKELLDAVDTYTELFKSGQSEEVRHNRVTASKAAIKARDEAKKQTKQKNDGPIFEKDIDKKFEVTSDMIALFGEGYSRNEYRKMFNKYEKLKMNYTLQTSLHQEALATYVRFKVKEEDATARGDVAEAKKWYDAAQSAAENGKLTPRQLSQSDLQGGINNFSDIFKAVEQAVDIVPILPQFKYRPNDAIDFIIWCYINYARDLRGLPQCSYEDVYKFYDRKKEEYIKQYGDPNHIFDSDPSESLRDTVKQFITLPSNYDDIGGDNNAL